MAPSISIFLFLFQYQGLSLDCVFLLVAFFVDLDETIFDQPLLKDHSFFFDISVSLEAIHDHVVSKTWVNIIDEHFDKMMFREGVRDFGSESFPSL